MHIGAELLPRQTLTRDRLAQLIDVHAVLHGDLAEGLIDLGIGNPDAGVIGLGNLQLAQDHPIQHLPLKLADGRQLLRITGVLRLDRGDLTIEFTAQDDVAIQHGDDAIELFGRHQLGLGQRGAKDEKQDQGGKQLVHAHEDSAGAGRNGAGL